MRAIWLAVLFFGVTIAHAKDRLATGISLEDAKEMMTEYGIPHGPQHALQMLSFEKNRRLYFAALPDEMTLVITYDSNTGAVLDISVSKLAANPTSRADRVAMHPEAILLEDNSVHLVFKKDA